MNSSSLIAVLFLTSLVYAGTIYPHEEELPSIDGETGGLNFNKESEEIETDLFLIFWPLQWLFEMLCGFVPDDPMCGYDVVRGNRNFTNGCQMRTVNWVTGRRYQPTNRQYCS